MQVHVHVNICVYFDSSCRHVHLRTCSYVCMTENLAFMHATCIISCMCACVTVWKSLASLLKPGSPALKIEIFVSLFYSSKIVLHADMHEQSCMHAFTLPILRRWSSPSHSFVLGRLDDARSKVEADGWLRLTPSIWSRRNTFKKIFPLLFLFRSWDGFGSLGGCRCCHRFSYPLVHSAWFWVPPPCRRSFGRCLICTAVAFSWGGCSHRKIGHRDRWA
jgi:hypothetical protein